MEENGQKHTEDQVVCAKCGAIHLNLSRTVIFLGFLSHRCLVKERVGHHCAGSSCDTAVTVNDQYIWHRSTSTLSTVNDVNVGDGAILFT